MERYQLIELVDGLEKVYHNHSLIVEALGEIKEILKNTSAYGLTREQVEKWKGEWEWYDEEIGSPLEGVEREWGWRCSKCKVVLPDDFDDPDNPPAMRFCPSCGVALTDEAVEITMERLEVLKDGTAD